MTHRLFWKGIVAGVATGLALSIVMVPLIKLGVSPLPRPVGLAFAEWLFGRMLPMPVGLLFHLAYVTGWSTLYVLAARNYLQFFPILAFGLVLWLIAIFIFLPLIGWGIAAMSVAGVKGIPATLIPHLLFSVFFWISCRLFVPRSA